MYLYGSLNKQLIFSCTTLNSLVFIIQRVCVYCPVRTESLNTIQINRLVAGLSLWRPGLHPRSVHVRSIVDIVAQGQVFIRIFRFSPAILFPPLLHTHLYLQAVLSRKPGSIVQKSVFS
jgi:hypothetical protein